jgi:hypothetical protein
MMHDMDDKTLKWFCMISLQRRVLYSQTPFIWSSRTGKNNIHWWNYNDSVLGVGALDWKET